MKPKHLKQLKKHLPDAIPKINALFEELGLTDFVVHSLEVKHRNDDICSPACANDEVCDQRLVHNKWVPYCRPRRPGD